MFRHAAHLYRGQKLNRLNVSIFTPSLLFSKVAFFLSPGLPIILESATNLLTATTAKLRELWVIPIVFVVTTLVSMLSAYVLSVILRLKRSQRCVVLSCGHEI